MTQSINRRHVLTGLAGGAAFAAGAWIPVRPAIAAPGKLKVGLMLPYSGTFAAIGNKIADAFKLRVNELGGRIGGLEVQYFPLDDESESKKAKDNAAKLIVKEKVDVLVGTVHSGVAIAMAEVAREEGTMMICPNAGADAITRSMCAPNIFRTSFSSWQSTYPAGSVVLKDGHKKVVTITWNYPAGKEMMQGFKESFVAGGGILVKEILLDFPNVEFQAHLTDIASLKPDAVFTFFGGAGALKFLKDFAAAGLQGKIPLYGPGFLTESYREAGAAANGVKTTLHYADALDLPTNRRFRRAFAAATGRDADVFAVQGYDAAQLLQQGIESANGDFGATKVVISAMERAEIDSPRGKFVLSAAHNPIQNIYLREIVAGEEKVLRIAHAALADPAAGCALGRA